jgi:hypothetical protein
VAASRLRLAANAAGEDDCRALHARSRQDGLPDGAANVGFGASQGTPTYEALVVRRYKNNGKEERRCQERRPPDLRNYHRSYHFELDSYFGRNYRKPCPI